MIASSSRGVVVSEMATGIPLSEFISPRQVVEVHFDSSSRRLIGASFDGAARVWTIDSPSRTWRSPEVSADCGIDVSLEPDRRIVAFGCRRETKVWDSATDKLLATLPGVGPGKATVSPVVSTMGDLTAIAHGNQVDVYRVPGGELWRTVQHTSRITTVRFASEGHALLAGGEDGTLLILRDDDTEAIRISMGKAALDVAAFLPAGRVVTVDMDRRSAVLDIERRTRVARCGRRPAWAHFACRATVSGS